MAKWLVEFYEDLGDEMSGPYRAIVVEATSEETARIATLELHSVSKFTKLTDLDVADNKVKLSYYENEYNPFTKTGHYNGD